MKRIRFPVLVMTLLAAACASPPPLEPREPPEHWFEVLRASEQHSDENRIAYSQLAAHGEAALPGIIEGLRGADEEMRFNALGLVRLLGPRANPALPALIELVETGDDGTAFFAMLVLGDIGADAKPSVPAIAARLRYDPASRAYPELRTYAATTLGRIGPAASQAVPALAEALEAEDPQGTFRPAVRKALQSILEL